MLAQPAVGPAGLPSPAMSSATTPYDVHGPAAVSQPLLLDSPHSGRVFPADFGAAVSEHALRDGEDCFVDELWRPATARGVWLLAARCARTYIDVNRHAGDVDLDLLEGGHWPDEHRPSGKAAIGKALVWRTLADGTPIYRRRLGVDEMRARIERWHRPYRHFDLSISGNPDFASGPFGRPLFAANLTLLHAVGWEPRFL